MIKVGIDTGGTFTDLIAVDVASGIWFTAKVPSTPRDPLAAIVTAIEAAGIDVREISQLILGTTVGTNALIERKGAKVVYLTTEGFEDVPFIQRGNRKFHYDLHWIKPRPFLDRADCLGVTERLDYHGRVDTPLKLGSAAEGADDLADALRRRIDSEGLQSVAVSLLFSYLNPTHEQALAAWLHEQFPDLTVSLSHQVAPVWREYERGLTTIVDAYLKPLLRDFITGVDRGLRQIGFDGAWALMKSNGGNRIAEAAANEPVQFLLSGLAGGVMGGRIFGLSAAQDLITLDMGGTSCDIAVISNGQQRYTMQFDVEFGLPVTLPTIDVTTIGAGGGSIAWVDGGGFLRVGPRSAGADPGPVCYAAGGNEPTVTDANLVLGRLNPDYFLGGAMYLDKDLATKAVRRLGERLDSSIEETALSIIALADANMADAIRLRTVEVGIDPRGYTLVAFGGAGALHGTAVARRLGVAKVVIPPHPGLCSAFGVLAADLRSDKVWTAAFRSDQVDASKVDRQVQRLSLEARTELITEGYAGQPEMVVKLALRYLGQNYEHDIELPVGTVTDEVMADAFERFNAMHDEFYGYHLGGEIVEIVNLTVTAIGASEVILPVSAIGLADSQSTSRDVCFGKDKVESTPVYRRHGLPRNTELSGPLLVEEQDATTLLESGDVLTSKNDGSLHIRIEQHDVSEN